MEGEGGEKNEQLVYGPADVAARLGVSPAGLRRLAVVYERVYGELRRDPRLGRVWPQEAVERLGRARNMVNTGQAVSVESALNALASGDPSAYDDPRPPEALARSRGAPDQEHALEALVGELRALRQTIEEQNRRLHALEEQNRQLQATLPPPREEPPPPRWGRAVRLSQPLRWLTSRVARDAASGSARSRRLWTRGRSLLARTARRGR
jgi:uncharacterized coiled-coil protein SlyX